MNKIYVIIPLLLVVAFGGLYASHTKHAAEAARAAAAKAEAEAQAKKQEAENQARADADRRAAERAAEEKRLEDKKRARWEATGREVATDTADYLARTTSRAAEVKALEDQLAALRAEKTAATQAEFDAALELERQRVQKRNAELDIQRLVEVVARKNGTTLAPTGAIP